MLSLNFQKPERCYGVEFRTYQKRTNKVPRKPCRQAKITRKIARSSYHRGRILQRAKRPRRFLGEACSIAHHKKAPVVLRRVRCNRPLGRCDPAAKVNLRLLSWAHINAIEKGDLGRRRSVPDAARCKGNAGKAGNPEDF